MLLRPCDDPRLLEGLRHSCGPLFMNVLEDSMVIEIMLNPDGSLWIEKYGRDHERIGEIALAQSRIGLNIIAELDDFDFEAVFFRRFFHDFGDFGVRTGGDA